MIDKSESVNWPDAWWVLGADHLNFEGVMSDFRKSILQTDFEREKHANKFQGETCTEKITAHDV